MGKKQAELLLYNQDKESVMKRLEFGLGSFYSKSSLLLTCRLYTAWLL